MVEDRRERAAEHEQKIKVDHSFCDVISSLAGPQRPKSAFSRKLLHITLNKFGEYNTALELLNCYHKLI